MSTITFYNELEFREKIQRHRDTLASSKSCSDKSMEYYYELYNEYESSIIGSFVNGKAKIDWVVAPAARVKKIWLDFARMGFVRDEKGLEKIASIISRNIVKLDVCNALAGHDTMSTEDMFDSAGYDWDNITEKERENFYWEFLETQYGPTISDYGLQYLRPYFGQIYDATTAEQKLYAVDRALNVVHQRSDLAKLFIEGGSETLLEISNQK